ncbi:putative transcription factor bZIP family [Dioscorea sansibarensis]
MGKREVDTPTKTHKASPSQDPTPTPQAAYPDWASLHVAYYNSAGTTPVTPPGYFHFSVAPSPQGQPYMWAPQILPPYGTPPSPYVAIYPPMGLYPHPATPTTATANGVETDSKSVEKKEKNSTKKSKESLGILSMNTGKHDENDKGSGTSANALSQSGESGSDISSEGSDANSESDSQKKQNGSGEEAAQNEKTEGNTSNEGSQAQKLTAFNYVVPLAAIPPGGVNGARPTANLGVSYWGGPSSSLTMQGGNMASTATAVPSNHNVPIDPVIQDERELKRQRRKQANRESARRSRLRKLAESEELAQRLVSLSAENNSLKLELGRLKENCEKLATENASLNEELQKCMDEEAKEDSNQNQHTEITNGDA